MISIKDVARHAGVSTMTVSRVINETGYVSTQTKEKVLAVIHSTGYKVNQTAVGLRTGKISSVGVIISDISNPFFPSILKGIDHVCSENHYTTMVFNTGEDREKELRYIDLLKQKSVKGIIISSCVADYEKEKSVFSDLIPVFFNRKPKGITADVVLSANHKAAFLATEFLIKAGHLKIALINGTVEMSTFRERQQGFLDAMNRYGVPVYEPLLVSGDYSVEGGYQSTKKVFSGSIAPDAILPGNNFMTQGVYLYLKDHRIRVPEDVSIVGYDDTDWCSLVDPAITVIEQNRFEMGKKAAEILFHKLNNGNLHSFREIRLDPEFILRDSVKTVSQRQ